MVCSAPNPFQSVTQKSSTVCPSCNAKASGKFCNQCGASLLADGCRSCGAALPPGSRFCAECGASVGADAVGAGGAVRRSSRGASTYAPWGLAALLLVMVVAYFLGQSAEVASVASDPSAAAAGGPVAPFAAGGGGAGGAPDITNMTPRERAGRLYDRIMRYAEEGKRDSAAFFAPMALASFEMLGAELDLDARYDYGRVAGETGNFALAQAQSDTILQKSPNHLLGLALAARTATQQGNTDAAAKVWMTFLAVRDVELVKNLPEYQAHRADIDQAERLAKGGK